MIFYNNEGTENGGLIFGGRRDADGNVVDSGGSLSFDNWSRQTAQRLAKAAAGRSLSSPAELLSWDVQPATDIEAPAWCKSSIFFAEDGWRNVYAGDRESAAHQVRPPPGRFAWCSAVGARFATTLHMTHRLLGVAIYARNSAA
jgi:hypothetical protein